MGFSGNADLDNARKELVDNFVEQYADRLGGEDKVREVLGKIDGLGKLVGFITEWSNRIDLDDSAKPLKETFGGEW